MEEATSPGPQGWGGAHGGAGDDWGAWGGVIPSHGVMYCLSRCPAGGLPVVSCRGEGGREGGVTLLMDVFWEGGR